MPPKAKKEDLSAAPQIVQRPQSANDLEIVSTVKHLQGLVNTEVKWRNRVSSAKHISQVSQLKIQKLLRLVDSCKDGIESLNSQLTEFFASLQETAYSNAPVNVSSAGLVTRATAPTVGAAGGAGAPGTAPSKGAALPGSKSAVPVDDAPTAEGLQRRKEQLAHLCSMLQVFYSLPRMNRERQPPRAANANDMQREFELAVKLALPNVPPAAEPAAASKKPNAAGALRPPKAPKPSETIGTGGFDPFLGDLPASDFFVLPMPKGIDSSIMQYLFLLRSKRLRLEHCMSLFQSELEPLSRRISCTGTMGVVGQYSLEAVAPLIQNITNAELSLQKIRQQEDQAYLAKRAASAPPPPATGKK